MFKFTQVAICRNSVADSIDYASSSIKKSIRGDLNVMLQTTTGMVLFKMNQFQYGINPNDQILYEDKDPQFKLMLCLDSSQQNSWILKINDNVQLVYFILSQRCKLIHRRASKMIIQGTDLNKDQMTKKHQKLQVTQKTQGSEQKKQQSSQYKLIQASKTFSQALKNLGSFIASGIQNLGHLISKKVQTPNNHMTVSPIIKFLIQKSVGASKKILEFNVEKSAKLFRLAANQVVNLESTITKTQAGKKLKQNGKIDTAKDNLKIGLQAIVNVYDGLHEGYDQVTKGVANGTNHIISARYGKDAGDMALKIAQGYRNVNKMTKAPNDALKKVLVQTAKNQIKRE